MSATVGAFRSTTLGAARALLRKQQALGNGGYLNMAARHLIVPAETETAAELVLAQATRHVTGTEPPARGAPMRQRLNASAG